jgi:predicted ATPase
VPDAAALADVAELCRRLDGVPLAIELAAGSLRALGVGELVARLRRRVELPADRAQDRPARQRTLRDAVDWSYALLGAEERHLFRRLAVFAGGWASTKLAAVAGAGAGDPAEGLDELVANSLVVRTAAGPAAREFARDPPLRESPPCRFGWASRRRMSEAATWGAVRPLGWLPAPSRCARSCRGACGAP